MSMFNQIACGGTFDLLHKGHKAFLKNVLNKSDKVILGLTSNLYVQSFKNGSLISDFEIRRQKLEQFLVSIQALQKVKIVAIDDVYGSLLTNLDNPQAIAVTTETQKNAEEINSKRKTLGFPELKIVVIPIELAEDGKPISATRIRNGEINRDGSLYFNPSWKNRTFHLPESLRSILQEPFGKVLTEIPSDLDGSKVVAIGDITVQKFNSKNVEQLLSIIDFQVQRQKKFNNLSELGFSQKLEISNIKNPAGIISSDLFIIIQKAFKTKKRKIIFVEGEEDLAFLPAMLCAPLGFTIFYGQPAHHDSQISRAVSGRPNQGLVQVDVTEENKEKVYQLLSQFES